MTPPPSRVLQLLRSGGYPIVMKLNLTEPRVVEIAGLSGADAVWFCNEHIAHDASEQENQIRAARIHGMDSMVRVSRGSYSDYVRPLEAGATGILVPHVASADEAREAVDRLRFRPVGRRALDGANVDARFGQFPLKDYVAYSNAERFIALMIESPEGLAEVEKIAAVPGFDMLLFGPGDFSHRIDRLGDFAHEEIVAARRRVGAAARKHGKFGMTALIAPVPELIAEGYQCFAAASDVAGLGAHFNSTVKSLRETLASTKGERVAPNALGKP